MSGRGASQNTAGGKERQPDFTWEVKANDRCFHEKFRKKQFLCFTKPKYAGNEIKTSKYNVLTFLPLNIYEQFHRACNLYFLFVIILQTVPAISTLPWFAIMLPLLSLLVVRGFRDLFDDIARHKSDSMINSRPCDILEEKSFSKKKWRDIHVGDIVRLKNDDFVPADLLLLHSSEPNSLCYVETADIDGETNLKFKQALMVTHTELGRDQALSGFDGSVICEEPNSKMHTFIGTLEWRGNKYALDNEKVLLRGCRIRNTETCYGLVIYAGIDSKIMKNCGRIIVKKTKLDRMTDQIVIIIFIMLVLSNICLAIAAGFWSKWFQEKHSYIPALAADITPAYDAFLIFWGYTILLSTIVPMSMFITLEFIHLVHSLMIGWDLEMYYAAKDTPANARSTSLNDLLGQIEYIFSDKTGTLTQNIMTFKKCCINGKIYGTTSDSTSELQELSFCWNPYADKKFRFYDKALVDVVRSDEGQVVKEFFRLLALCHTVMVEEKDGDLLYQAASPDEEALVTAARNFGYVFLGRTQDSITVSELGVERTYQVLAMLDFNSVRKRMSIIVRDPEGKIKLYTKGADNVILERLDPDCPNDDVTEKALDMFAGETLRTLCVACKEVDESVYIEWSKKHHEASVALQRRAEQLDAIYEEIEEGLQLLGATAIEDKLQDGVPETIQLLKKGNIKVWVLTGDKQETAVNIGFSCRLLSEDMEILEEKEICDILEEYWEHNNNITGSGEDLLRSSVSRKHRASLHHGRMALVITGDFLGKILGTKDKKVRKPSIGEKLTSIFGLKMAGEQDDEETLRERAFVDLASRCQAVICCRVTPKQKAIVVKLVKRYQKATTLAIGDGANDVNMIKTADIGVGISGQEGTQAVQSSDYALAQFSYLQRLLLVHGRWSYLRICKFLRYFYYKTFASVLGHVWFACFNGFTALMVYDSWFIAFYAVIFTAFPVLSMGLLEQDVSAKASLNLPQLYKVGQDCSLFSYRTFCWSFFQGVSTSLATFFIPYGAFKDTAGPEGVCDYQAFAVTTATAGVLAVTVEIIMDTSYWTVVSGLAVLISPVLYFLVSLLTQSYPLFKGAPDLFRFPDVNKNALSKLYIWLVILLAVIVGILPSLIGHFFTRMTSTCKVQEKQEPYKDKKLAENTVELNSQFRRNTSLRRSAYAFSQGEGYADLIVRGTSIRRKKSESPAVPPAEQAPTALEQNA
ncbi:phospholipid-transporting ATPase IK-like [Ambystoma mexicanum]|uniref:phospholipid-transporting ATPase IK-like n=1 Tax=Ambystoma mexicanum TaxID=8296 RepID=UPI0037E7706D